MKKVAHHTARWVLILSFILLLLVASLTGVARISLPYVGDYRSNIQAYIADFLGRNVEIGSLELRWEGFGPRLEVADIVLDVGNNVAEDVRLDKIYLDLDLLRSVLKRSWQIGEVSIVGAKFAVDYSGKLDFKVYGERVAGEQSASGVNLDVLGWLMQADRVAILDSSVDFLHTKKSLHFTIRNLNARAGNVEGAHKIRVDMKVPELSPLPIELALDFSGDRADLSRSSGSFTASLARINLAKGSDIFHEHSSVEASGKIDFSIWGRWSDAQLEHLRLITDNSELGLENTQTGASAKVPRLFSDWVLHRADDGVFRLGLNRLVKGGAIPEYLPVRAQLTASVEEDIDWRFDVAGKTLDLQSFTPLISVFNQVAGDSVVADHWVSYAPTGQVSDWRVLLQGEDRLLSVINAVADFKDLGFGDMDEQLAARGFDASLKLENNTGMLIVAENDVSLNLPMWFSQPLKLTELSSNLGFKWQPGKFAIASEGVHVQADTFAATGSVFVQKLPGSEQHLDINIEAEAIDALEAKRFFPDKLFNPDLVAWLDRSVLGGTVTGSTFVLKGPSVGIPYASGEGVFEADIDIENADINFLPDWPAGKVSTAQLRFRQNSLTIDSKDGESEGNKIIRSQIRIADFKQPVLHLEGSYTSTVPDALRYINKSPLKRMFGPLISESQGRGDLNLALELEVPLHKSAEAIQLTGDIEFLGNHWSSPSLELTLDDIQGVLSFSDKSLSSEGLTTEYFGEKINLTAKSDPNNAALFSRIDISGDIAVADVLSNYQLPIAHWFDGHSPWQVQLDLTRPLLPEQGMGVELNASSNLQGTAVSLPLPYKKLAAAQLPLTANMKLDSNGDGQTWRFSYANDVFARVRTQAAANGMKSLEVSFKEQLGPYSSELEGIRLDGRAKLFSFDRWVTAISTVIEKMPASETVQPILPLSGQLRVDNFYAGEVNVGPARLSLGTDNAFVKAKVVSKWLVGDLFYPREYWDRNNPMLVNLLLLDKQFIDALATAEGESDDRVDPRLFPAIDATIVSFVWDDIHLSDVKMRTVPTDDGIRTSALGFVHKDLQMTGESSWRVLDPQNISEEKTGHRTDISLRILSDNVGLGMDGIGVSGAFADGQGEMGLRLAWNDAAYAPALEELVGEISFSFKNGQILAVEPGAAKVLGLFALQAVPRRLLLDFDDVTNDGLLYDEIKGSFLLSKGEAKTQYMQMKGPIGVVSSSGSTNFVKGTYDQQIVVLPHVSSALPIIGFLSAGATGGIGVLVVDQVLKGIGVNFDEIVKRVYKLDGSWENPELTRVHVRMKPVPLPDNR